MYEETIYDRFTIKVKLIALSFKGGLGSRVAYHSPTEKAITPSLR